MKILMYDLVLFAALGLHSTGCSGMEKDEKNAEMEEKELSRLESSAGAKRSLKHPDSKQMNPQDEDSLSRSHFMTWQKFIKQEAKEGISNQQGTLDITFKESPLYVSMEGPSPLVNQPNVARKQPSANQLKSINVQNQTPSALYQSDLTKPQPKSIPLLGKQTSFVEFGQNPEKVSPHDSHKKLMSPRYEKRLSFIEKKPEDQTSPKKNSGKKTSGEKQTVAEKQLKGSPRKEESPRKESPRAKLALIMNSGLEEHLKKISMHELSSADKELFDAIKKNDRTHVVKILAEGARIDVQEQTWGFTPLIFAIIEETNWIIKFLLKRGANVEIADWEGKTALLRALLLGQKKTIELLCNTYKASSEVVDVFGQNVLHLALFGGNDEQLIADLLERRDSRGQKIFDVNCANEQGFSPLMYAVYFCSPAVVRLLLQRGAKVDHTNMTGDTTWNCAVKRGNQEILALIQCAIDTQKE